MQSSINLHGLANAKEIINCECCFVVTVAAAAKKADVPHDEQPIEENINRLQLEGDEARSVDEAISVLGCVMLSLFSLLLSQLVVFT